MSSLVKRKSRSSTRRAARLSTSSPRATWRSRLSWMFSRPKRTLEADPLVQLENQVRQAELLLELRLLELEILRTEAHKVEAQLVLQAKEQEQLPVLMQVQQQHPWEAAVAVPWTEPPPQEPQDPWTEPPAQDPMEDRTPTPPDEAARILGLSLPQS